MARAVVNSEEARESVEWLLDNAAEIGAVEAELDRAEFMLKSAFSLTAQQASGTVAEREAHAYRSQKVKDAADVAFQAKAELRKMRALQTGHRVRVDAWQTACANFRAAEKGFGSAS